jgi:hypothetical protein
MASTITNQKAFPRRAPLTSNQPHIIQAGMPRREPGNRAEVMHLPMDYYVFNLSQLMEETEEERGLISTLESHLIAMLIVSRELYPDSGMVYHCIDTDA